MKQLAARDYEDLLQCSIPAFEGLLDETHNKQVMKLLYQMAEWHALAKLRMHTDSTLEHLRCLTKVFGSLMRQFRDHTCPQFNTVDLPREVAARNRHQQHHGGRAKVSKNLTDNGPERLLSASSSSHQVDPSPNTASEASLERETTEVAQVPSLVPSSRKLRSINLSTVKFHFLGDYVQTIQRYGCTDSYSTQLV